MGHQIWVEYDDNGNIIQCWEAPDPVIPGQPENCPIELCKRTTLEGVVLPTGTIAHPDPPSDLPALLKERDKTGRALSDLIIERKKVDKETGKLKNKEAK